MDNLVLLGCTFAFLLITWIASGMGRITCTRSTLRIMRILDRRRLDYLIDGEYSRYHHLLRVRILFMASRGAGHYISRSANTAPPYDDSDHSDFLDLCGGAIDHG